MTLTLYGIPNCDTVKKARVWLDTHGRAHAFHDFKKQGADPARIAAWAEQAGWDRIVNRAGTTYKKLTAEDQAALTSPETGAAVLAANPSCIKRPVVEYPGGLLVGFKPAEWEAVLG